MKFVYNLVTFLAALVILTYAGWEIYLHRNVIANALPFNAPGNPEKKCNDCKCTDCRCTANKKCVEACTCGTKCGTDPGCCQPKK